MEVRMLKHPLANVVVKSTSKSHEMLAKVIGLLGNAGIDVYGITLGKDRLKFYVRESEYEKALRILDNFAKGDVEFYVIRGVGMISISGGEGGRSVDVLVAPFRNEVKIFDLIRSDNSVQLFLELKKRGAVFQKIVKKVTDGFRVTEV